MVFLSYFRNQRATNCSGSLPYLLTGVLNSDCAGAVLQTVRVNRTVNLDVPNVVMP
jgi:hypothetical protein